MDRTWETLSKLKYWHFAKCYYAYDPITDRLSGTFMPQLGYGDARPIVLGETLTVSCVPVPCHRGLHAAFRAYDALSYAKEHYHPILLTRVTVGGSISEDTDKVAAQQRTVIAMLTIEQTNKLMIDFARWSASIACREYPGPQEKINAYLTTGDGTLLEAAKDELSHHKPVSMMTSRQANVFQSIAYALDKYDNNLPHEQAAYAAACAIQSLVDKQDEKTKRSMTYEKTSLTRNRYERVFTAEFERRCLAAIGETP